MSGLREGPEDGRLTADAREKVFKFVDVLLTLSHAVRHKTFACIEVDYDWIQSRLQSACTVSTTTSREIYSLDVLCPGASLSNDRQVMQPSVPDFLNLRSD